MEFLTNETITLLPQSLLDSPLINAAATTPGKSDVQSILQAYPPKSLEGLQLLVHLTQMYHLNS